AGLAALVDQGTQNISNITALLDAVINTTNAAIYAKDKVGRMVFANDACLRVIGRERAEVIGLTEADFHPDSAEAAAIRSNDRRVVASNRSATMEEAFTSDAGPRVFLSSKAPMRNHAGEVIGLVGVSSDITERKQIEAQLFISQQRFDAAISAFEGLVWTASPSGGVLSVNAQWAVLTGLPASAAMDGGWRAVQHPDDIAPTFAHWQECLRDVRPFIGEYRLRNRDGKYQTMLVRAIPVRDPQGRVAEWVGLNIDVTEARNVALQHEAALTRLSVAMEAANTGAFEIVPDQPEASTFDGRAVEIWGQNPGAAAADLLNAVHPDDRAEVAGVLEGLHARQLSESVEIEFRILRKDGTTRWVALRAKTFAPAGAPLRLVGTVRDVSLRREQQDRIQFLMRELAHRSKNALAVVQAIARQTVKSSRSLEAFQASFEARVQGMARSLDLLVKYDWTAVSITELIQSQMAHIIDNIDEKISVHGPEIYLKPEAAQNIGLALHELATNATKYGALASDTGKIELEWGLAQSKDGADVFKMHWREKGGPPVVPPDSHGFGHTVIHRVVQAALAGDSVLHFHDSGVQWDLVIPARFVSTSLVEGPP
ncbi:MAG: PAS domain S-box protein, partial [Hyphomicrobiales bacterium]|nr:PAS domain S-box protein [Hyphomicrobiales bacterium]